MWSIISRIFIGIIVLGWAHKQRGSEGRRDRERVRVRKREREMPRGWHSDKDGVCVLWRWFGQSRKKTIKKTKRRRKLHRKQRAGKPITLLLCSRTLEYRSWWLVKIGVHIGPSVIYAPQRTQTFYRKSLANSMLLARLQLDIQLNIYVYATIYNTISI